MIASKLHLLPAEVADDQAAALSYVFDAPTVAKQVDEEHDVSFHDFVHVFDLSVPKSWS